RVRHRCRARGPGGDLRGEAHRGHVACLPRPGPLARPRGRRWHRRRGRADSGRRPRARAWPGAGVVRARPRAGNADRGAAGARRRRPERARRAPRGPSRAPGASHPHAARRRAGAPARARVGRGGGAAPRERARGRRAERRDRRAQGGRHPGRGAPGRRPPRRERALEPGPRHRGHRRRALRDDRGALGARARAVRGRLRGRLRARARGPDRGGEARSRGVGHRHRRHRRDPGGPPAVSAAGRARAIVDLGAVERNCALLAGALGGGARLCAVVKANGYGHGAVECARAALAGGASALAVATAAEAAILVMGALTPDELEAALGARAEIAAWRPELVRLAAERAEALGVRPRIHVKYDTGMGRLGERDAGAVLGLLDQVAGEERLELAALWTHFATADELDAPFFGEQLARFAALAERARSAHPGLELHAANSAATLREPASHFDMVRCGIAVYGLDPFGADPFERGLEPALSLHSYVAAVKQFEPGDSAGYGRRWIAERATKVGVLPIGYGDGVRRGLANNAEVLVGGRRHPLVGMVSMDNITVELGPDSAVEPGAPAVLIGEQGGERILCEEVARRLGTINYEVTCGIS